MRGVDEDLSLLVVARNFAMVPLEREYENMIRVHPLLSLTAIFRQRAARMFKVHTT